MEGLSPQAVAFLTAMSGWLWTHYGQRMLAGAAKKGWDEVRWTAAVGEYLESLYGRVAYVRILGRMEGAAAGGALHGREPVGARAGRAAL